MRSPRARAARSPSDKGSTAVTTTPLGFFAVLMGYRVSNSSVYISKEVYQISRSKLNGLELGRSSLSHSGADDNSKGFDSFTMLVVDPNCLGLHLIDGSVVTQGASSFIEYQFPHWTQGL